MSEFVGFIAVIVNLFFFFWFGSTLNSINRHLGRVADHAERQTKLLASIAKSPDGDSTPVPAAQPTKHCRKCDGLIPADAIYCVLCGRRA
jgi:hypothetical protein